MELLLWFVAAVGFIVAVISLVDVFRRHTSGWSMAAWTVAIVLLPYIGSIAYWVMRPATAAEVEASYLVDRDLHRSH